MSRNDHYDQEKAQVHFNNNDIDNLVVHIHNEIGKQIVIELHDVNHSQSEWEDAAFHIPSEKEYFSGREVEKTYSRQN
ncbi:Hypothetical predicted protein [Cloeon dipterum]|uniref:Uncharacterized protein n=1 Tax=Cloeon dipterum TaxID=197152 RepID=A0A8S1DPW0_9INSE|nr:Hypothetical predicted protein [Cloeon dipterum]